MIGFDQITRKKGKKLVTVKAEITRSATLRAKSGAEYFIGTWPDSRQPDDAAQLFI